MRDGVPVERDTIAGGEEWKKDATAAVQTGLTSLPSHSVAHFGDGWVPSKKRRKRAVM